MIMNSTQNPILYHIRVRGQIPASWIDVFADLHIEKEADACGEVSNLRGVFDDRAALQGVLNNLYTLGLSLISVEAQDECQGGNRDVKSKL